MSGDNCLGTRNPSAVGFKTNLIIKFWLYTWCKGIFYGSAPWATINLLSLSADNCPHLITGARPQAWRQSSHKMKYIWPALNCTRAYRLFMKQKRSKTLKILTGNIGKIELELHEYKLVKINKIGKFCQGCWKRILWKVHPWENASNGRGHTKLEKVPVYYYYKWGSVWAVRGRPGLY